MADVLNKLNSANYVTVKVTDNAIVNGNNLLAAYALAKTRLPNGAALSTSNRLAVILPPAKYNLGTQSLILDTQYIDIIGSTSDRSKHYITSNVGEISRGTVEQTANNVKLYNLTIENSNTSYSLQYDDFTPAAYFADNNLNLTYVENVLFTSNSTYVWSMRVATQYSGTFKDCAAGNYSFGYDSLTSGTFISCTGGAYSFGGTGYANGTFRDCTGGVHSFGGDGGEASGDFKDCTGGTYSFGGDGGTANGTFIGCIGGIGSFGRGGTASGDFINCTGGDYSFGAEGTASGTFTGCTGGIYSFGGHGGTASGNFTGCTGGIYSFGGAGENPGGNAGGIFKDCTGGNYSFGGGATADGNFTNCNGGTGSFGGSGGTASGDF